MVRYCAAIWNYAWTSQDVVEHIPRFVAMGYDAISFIPDQCLKWDASGRADVLAALKAHDLAVTLHGKIDDTAGGIASLQDWLGARLVNYTIDAPMRWESIGTVFDGELIGRRLGETQLATRGTSLRLGVEDFPVDRRAFDVHARHLAPLAAGGRWGILIDVGHYHLRRRFLPAPAEFLGGLPVPLLELHIHDNDGLKDQHGPIGYGSLDFAELAAAVKTVGFDGVSTSEAAPSLHGREPAQSLEEMSTTITAWRRLMEEARS